MFRWAQTTALVTVVLLSAGCTRWALRPQGGAAGQEETARNTPLSRLAPATGTAARSGGASESSPRDDVSDLKNLDPSLAIARLSERQSNPDEARRLYLRYIQKNPRHPLPHHRLGVMAARQAKYDEAEQHFMHAMQLAPPSAELLSDVGYLYYLLDRLDEAEQVLRRASAAEPAHPVIHNNLALVAAAKGDYSESMRNFRRVNDEAEARANLAYTLSQQGELEHARNEYLRALTLNNTLTNAAKALLQVDQAHRLEQLAMSQAQQQAEGQQTAADPLLGPGTQPAQQSASGPPQGVRPAAYDHPPAQHGSAMGLASQPPAAGAGDASLRQGDLPRQAQAAQLPQERGELAGMLMPLPAGPAPRPLEPFTAPQAAEAHGVVPAAWWNAGSDAQAVEPAAGQAAKPAAGVAVSLKDESSARKPVTASLRDAP